MRIDAGFAFLAFVCGAALSYALQGNPRLAAASGVGAMLVYLFLVVTHA